MFSILNDFRESQGISWGSLQFNPNDVGVSSILYPAGLQNHSPQLCWVMPGLLACVWMSGDREGTAGMSIYLSFLSIKNLSWCLPQLISQDATHSEQNPLLVVVGHFLHLIHTSQQVRGSEQTVSSVQSSFSMQWTASLRTQSLDLRQLYFDKPTTWDSEAWSLARNLCNYPAFCRHPPFQRADGSFLLPIYRSLEEGGSFGHDFPQILIFRAEDSMLLETRAPIDVPQSTGRVHGTIVVSRNQNELLQFFRSRLADRIYCSRSDLDGQNWSIPERTTLPNNNSSIQASRLLSGRLVMIYNRFCFEPDSLNLQPWGEANWPRTRWPLSIALSEDDGVTWPWIRDIDTGFGFCGTGNWMLNGQLAYPSILEGQPGELHVAYSWGGRTAIRYVCLHEHDIIGFIPES